MANEPARFVLSDDSINSYGFRVLTSGIDVDQFVKNPIMLWGHHSWDMPIGKWIDIEKKDGKLTAVAEFDENDETAKKVKQKVDAKILNACSIGFDVLETSSESAYLMQGQTRPTVTKAVIYEASIVNFPANSNALRLRKDGNLIELSSTGASLGDLLPKIQLAATGEEWFKTLGMKDEKEAIAQFQATLKAQEEMLIELGRAKGVVDAKNEAHYRQLAKSDPNGVLELFKKTETPIVSLHQTLKDATKNGNNGVGGDDRTKWTFDDWSKKDPDGLMRMRINEPEKYKQLCKEYAEAK